MVGMCKYNVYIRAININGCKNPDNSWSPVYIYTVYFGYNMDS